LPDTRHGRNMIDVDLVGLQAHQIHIDQDQPG
jgi:hypothetical protein